ncbi:MAG: tyrosine-type recombinase/integrase [Actinophytocola sp.]|nr:tyrosine-type recombinase/integrase [Actinophytocola sp.]
MVSLVVATSGAGWVDGSSSLNSGPCRAVRPALPGRRGAGGKTKVRSERTRPSNSTGLRRGELCGLRWPDVDLDAQKITVNITRVAVGYQVYEEEQAKTEAGHERKVPLGKDAVVVLREWRKTQLRQRLAAGPAYGPGDYLVADELGRPVHPDRVSKTWKRLAGRAGLPPAKLHAGRHFFVSVLRHLGYSIEQISRMVGHKDRATTEGVYWWMYEEAEQEATQMVEDVIPGISPVNRSETGS